MRALPSPVMPAYPYDLWSKGRNRNGVVFGFQNNRNPFIDNPEWVACLFLDECESGCPQDLDGDGQIEAFDLAIILGAWGQCSGCPTSTCSNTRAL